jgi:hypothetical protein
MHFRVSYDNQKKYIYYFPAQNQPACFIMGRYYVNCAVGTKYLDIIHVKYIFHFGIYERVELDSP